MHAVRESQRKKVGDMFEGPTLTLLTTTAAKTGRKHTIPLGYLEIEGLPVVVGYAADTRGIPVVTLYRVAHPGVEPGDPGI